MAFCFVERRVGHHEVIAGLPKDTLLADYMREDVRSLSCLWWGTG